MSSNTDAILEEFFSLFKNAEIKNFLLHFVPNNEFDSVAIKNLLQDTGEETVIKMLAHFQENLFDSSEQIKNGLNSDNVEMVWKAMHKLAGTSELLGFKNFSVQSRQLSKLVKNAGNLNDLKSEVFNYHAKVFKLYQDILATFPSLPSYL